MSSVKDSGQQSSISWQLFEIVVTYLSLFALAWIFFTRFLFHRYNLADRWVKLLFCTVFSLGADLLLLIIFDIRNLLGEEIRWFNWEFDLIGLSVLVTAVLPLKVFWSGLWRPGKSFYSNCKRFVNSYTQ